MEAILVFVMLDSSHGLSQMILSFEQLYPNKLRIFLYVIIIIQSLNHIICFIILVQYEFVLHIVFENNDTGLIASISIIADHKCT